MEQTQTIKTNNKAKTVLMVVFIVLLVIGIAFLITASQAGQISTLMTYSSLADLQAAYPNPTEEDLKGKQFAVGGEIFEYADGEWQSTGKSAKKAGTIEYIGADGKDGQDAASLYEIAVENGYTGSSEQFALSIAKFSEDSSNNGEKDVYEIMTELGYNGTREEFEQTFQGESGRNGRDGKDGVDGKDGIDGKDGKDGKNGRDGKDGKDGEDGEDGQDGTVVELSADNTWVLDGYDTKVLAKAYNPEIITLDNGRKVWAIKGEAIKTANDEYCYAESSDIDIQVTPTGEVQWAYTTGDDTEWKTLFETSSLVGPTVEFRLNSSVTPPVVEWKLETEDDTAWTELYSLDELSLSINPDTYEWELFGQPIGISAEIHNPYLEAGDPITVNGQEIIPQYWWVWDPEVDNGDGTYGNYVNTMVRANAVDGRNGV